MLMMKTTSCGRIGKAHFSKIYYLTLFQDTTLNITPTSEFHVLAMLILPTVGHFKSRGWCVLQWYNVHTKFSENRP
jgi:hypothetical protein